jgi:hypothetical protein
LPEAVNTPRVRHSPGTVDEPQRVDRILVSDHA